ncbi:hypothetical protein BDV93DRAFT_610474 [Ceratobasidium sp. AG-I]|nr:hypothetical protein BDV93DRAFT_610474 [Ceratobasidium sp. AG-I]
MRVSAFTWQGSAHGLNQAYPDFLCVVPLAQSLPRSLRSMDVHLSQRGNMPMRVYSIQVVQYEIQQITSGNYEDLSKSTLEAALFIVYYPEYLYILIDDRIIPALFKLLTRFPNNTSAFNFSIGFLLLRLIALVTAIGLLEESDQMAPFIESLGPPASRGRADASPSLTTWILKMIDEDMHSMSGTLVDFRAKLGWTLDENKEPTCLVGIGGYRLSNTLYLLEQCYTARNEVLNAYNSTTVLCWPVLLLVMWAHLEYSKLDERLPWLVKLRDVAFRRFLGSKDQEHFVMQALVNEFAGLIQPPKDHRPPVDRIDAQTVTSALVKKLSPRQTSSNPVKIRYLTLLTDYALQVTAHSGLHYWCRIFEAGFHRLWREFNLNSKSPGKDIPEQIMSYATLLLNATSNYFTWTSGLIFPGGSLTPDLISILVGIDVISFLGRLFLLPSAVASAENDQASVSTDAVNKTLCALSELIERLSENQSLARPALSGGYLNWLKTFNFMCQLRHMPIYTDHPLNSCIKEYTLSWTRLGQALGYFDQIKYTPCSYPRCSGEKEISSGFMACKACLRAVYCSGRCQQADWLFETAPHSEMCAQSS